MPSQRARSIPTWMAMVTMALATLGIAISQAPGQNAKTAKSKAPKGGLRAPGGAPPKKLDRNVPDPFANQPNDAQKNEEPKWPFHYKFKLISDDGTPLAALYFPAQRGTAPVVILVHEKGRLGKDFEDGIEDLKGKGLAEYLQGQGYAVLVVDLRGHGSNPRRELAPREGILLLRDLQAAYQFLVDRHNREELNLAKLGVVALGEGADLVTAWAATPGAGVSSEGRISDLGALVLISPLAEGFGYHIGPALAMVAPRLPVFVMAGERDNASLNPVKDVQATIVRQRQSKVEFFPTPLHGYRLLRFQPKVPDAIMGFFDSTIKKLRNDEWEPRYNLTPVAFTDVELVQKDANAAPAPAAANPAAPQQAAPGDEKKAAPKAQEPQKAPGKRGNEPKKTTPR
jgi:pimeloyl-ACP methyl ester carboxylesterase